MRLMLKQTLVKIQSLFVKLSFLFRDTPCHYYIGQEAKP